MTLILHCSPLSFPALFLHLMAHLGLRLLLLIWLFLCSGMIHLARNPAPFLFWGCPDEPTTASFSHGIQTVLNWLSTSEWGVSPECHHLGTFRVKTQRNLAAEEVARRSNHLEPALEVRKGRTNNPAQPKPPQSHIPKCHTHTSFKSLHGGDSATSLGSLF